MKFPDLKSKTGIFNFLIIIIFIVAAGTAKELPKITMGLLTVMGILIVFFGHSMMKSKRITYIPEVEGPAEPSTSTFEIKGRGVKNLGRVLVLVGVSLSLISVTILIAKLISSKN